MLTFAIVVIAAGAGLHLYLGSYLGEDHSPDQKYMLRYYSSDNPFKTSWSMPGGSSCDPRWVRLYDRQGRKLNEIYTNDCALENPVTWLEGKVVLPDGETVWDLP